MSAFDGQQRKQQASLYTHFLDRKKVFCDLAASAQDFVILLSATETRAHLGCPIVAFRKLDRMQASRAQLSREL